MVQRRKSDDNGNHKGSFGTWPLPYAAVRASFRHWRCGHGPELGDWHAISSDDDRLVIATAQRRIEPGDGSYAAMKRGYWPTRIVPDSII